MSLLVISCSLNPMSLSRILARSALTRLRAMDAEPEWIDLREMPLPLCDGDTASDDPNAKRLVEKVTEANGILLATPVYNYNVSAATKNLVELTGSAWTDKVVGFLCAAGGRSSYMAPMSLANSLMLDFRCIVIPRFVYASEDAFEGDSIADEVIRERLDELVHALVRITRALYPVSVEAKRDV